MVMRVVGIAALGLALSSPASHALASKRHGIVQRVSCHVVRYYVAKYSASTAEMWARSHGATDAQIEAARRCLRDGSAQAAQAPRWFSE
jgi:hypothetical protein